MTSKRNQGEVEEDSPLAPKRPRKQRAALNFMQAKHTCQEWQMQVVFEDPAGLVFDSVVLSGRGAAPTNAAMGGPGRGGFMVAERGFAAAPFGGCLIELLPTCCRQHAEK